MINVTIRAHNRSEGLTVADVRAWLHRYDAEVASYDGQDADHAEQAQITVMVRTPLACQHGTALELSAEAPARSE